MNSSDITSSEDSSTIAPLSSMTAPPTSTSESDGTPPTYSTSTTSGQEDSENPSKAKRSAPPLLPGLDPSNVTSLVRDGVLEVPSLTGSDLASCVLSRDSKRLSVHDLNWVGLELLKDCKAAGELKAAASVYSTIVTANKPGPSTPGKKGGPTDRRRKMLEQSARVARGASDASHATVDVGAGGDDE